MPEQKSLFEVPRPEFSNNGIGERYQIVLSDPPWYFEPYSAATTDQSRFVANKYSTMTIEQICELNVEKIVGNNAALFIWATWPMIKQAFEVIDAWGFEYKTLAWEWVKLTKTGKMWHFGAGYILRSNPEPCLFATKGSMPVAVKDELNVIDTWHDADTIISPVQQHSRKPEQAYAKIDRLYPLERYPNRIEIFASEYSAPLAKKYGFKTALGYAVDGRDVRDAIDEIAEGLK